MSDKESNDPKKDQSSAKESFQGAQDKAQLEKEPQEKVQWDKVQQQKVEQDKLQWDKVQHEELLSKKGDQSSAPSEKPDPLELLKTIGLDWRPEKEDPPADPVFDNAYSGMKNRTLGKSFARAPDKERMSKLLAAIPDLQKLYVKGGRADRFYPYLLIRSVVGERGDRPLNPSTQPTVSPDIWIAPGDPASNPDMPGRMGGEATLEPLWWNPAYSIAPRAHGFESQFRAGLPHTVYAHVWNLGRAPIIGVKVEFLYSWTSFYDEMSALDKHQSFGFARMDLGPRSSRHCHRLVKCPQAFYPRRPTSDLEPETHILVVRVSCIGDGITDPWMPLNDRHVASHFLKVTG